ncbi:hypothetical protein GQX74_005296 [Glossina fuscipes]|nr:hypothetical protein GQX74_005296 [Glossina fuscipes]
MNLPVGGLPIRFLLPLIEFPVSVYFSDIYSTLDVAFTLLLLLLLFVGICLMETLLSLLILPCCLRIESRCACIGDGGGNKFVLINVEVPCISSSANKRKQVYKSIWFSNKQQRQQIMNGTHTEMYCISQDHQDHCSKTLFSLFPNGYVSICRPLGTSYINSVFIKCKTTNLIK